MQTERPTPSPRKAVRIGIPVLVIGVLTLAALWRVGVPPDETSTTPGARTAEPRPGPLTRLADTLLANSVGRRASLENVDVLSAPTPRTLWLVVRSDGPGTGDELAFAVLDPDVRRIDDAMPIPGGRVTLIGLVRPAPGAAAATSAWQVDAATAAAIEKRGTYLHVTEIRPPTLTSP